MLFNTIPFWALFIVFLSVYAFVRKYSRVGMMTYVLACSLAFSWQANGWFMLLLPMTALVSYYLTSWMSELNGTKRKQLLSTVVVLDLIPLLYLKYTNFSIDLVNQIFHSNFALMDIVLPVGISFYTFQAISYSVDVYRRKFTDEVTLLEYLFYITFFPLILAGPITRAGTLLPQVRNLRPITERILYSGLFLIVVGILKKSVAADYIAQYNNMVFDDPMTYSGFENFMAMIGYSIQIYLDFSGYSDMAIGLAAMMGFRLKDNFNFPYQALSVQEFWHRWHISLSTWFRDYLYIPLGGNRKGTIRMHFNNFFTMLIAGLWHGSTLMFVIWGAMHGAALVVQKALKKPLLCKIPDNIFTKVCFWFMTFMYINFAWVFFRSTDMSICSQVFSQMFTDFDIAYLVPFVQVRMTWVVLVVGALLLHAIRERQYYRLQAWFIKSSWAMKLIIFFVVIQLAIEFHVSSVQPFIYYQF